MECLNFSTKPWNNATFGPLLIHWCLWAKKAFFRSESSPIAFSCSICIKTKDGKRLRQKPWTNSLIFLPKPWTYLIEKMQFKPILNRRFLKSNRATFRSRFHQNLFLDLFCTKTKGGESLNYLDRNHGLAPSELCKFGAFLKSVFL